MFALGLNQFLFLLLFLCVCPPLLAQPSGEVLQASPPAGAPPHAPAEQEALMPFDALDARLWPRGLQLGLGLALGHDSNPLGQPDTAAIRQDNWQAASAWLQGQWALSRQRLQARAQGEWRRSDVFAPGTWRSDTHAWLARWDFQAPGLGETGGLEGSLEGLDERMRRPWAMGPSAAPGETASDLEQHRRGLFAVQSEPARRLGWEGLLRSESQAPAGSLTGPATRHQRSALLAARWGQAQASLSPLRLGLGLRWSRQSRGDGEASTSDPATESERRDVMAALRWQATDRLLLLAQIEAAREQPGALATGPGVPAAAAERRFQTGEIALGWQASDHWRWAVGWQRWQGELARDALGASDPGAATLRADLANPWADSALQADVASLALNWRIAEKWQWRGQLARLRGQGTPPLTALREEGHLSRWGLSYQGGPQWQLLCSLETQSRRGSALATPLRREQGRCGLAWATGG
jgi:hypothetical protein